MRIELDEQMMEALDVSREEAMMLYMLSMLPNPEDVIESLEKKGLIDPTKHRTSAKTASELGCYMISMIADRGRSMPSPVEAINKCLNEETSGSIKWMKRVFGKEKKTIDYSSRIKELFGTTELEDYNIVDILKAVTYGRRKLKLKAEELTDESSYIKEDGSITVKVKLLELLQEKPWEIEGETNFLMLMITKLWKR